MRHILAIAVVLATLASSVEAKYMRATGGKPIKGRYIVMLNNSVGPDQVDVVARGLLNEHPGRLLGTMKHAFRGFGVEMTEQRARALARHPLVLQVEEDEEMGIASEPVDAAPRVQKAPSYLNLLTARSPRRLASDWNSESGCAWQGSYFLCSLPADDSLWALDRLDNSGLLYSYKAYAYTSTGSGVRAYVLDSGVWFDHQEFGQSPRQVGVSTTDPNTNEAANMLVDPDNYDTRVTGEEPIVAADGWPADYPCGAYTRSDGSHGTAVASVLAGKFSGVAKDAKIIPVKVISCNGQRPKLAMARGLDWIRGDMARFPTTQRGVVSLSTFINVPTEGAHLCETATEGVMTNCTSAVEHTINQLIGANIPVVASANNQNNGNCTTSPARMGYGNEANFASTHRVITVGGTMALAPNYVDQRWDCANTPEGCGTTVTGSNFGPCVSIYAPAYRVRVAGWEGPTSYRPFPQNSGTSYSAPIVAGLIARLMSTPAYSALSPHQLWLEIRNRAIGRNVQPADFDPSATTNTWLAYMSALE